MKKRTLLLLLMVLTLVLPLVPASAATYYYVSGTSSVKMREKPNTDAAVKDTYRADFAVVSYKKYDSTWAYVHFSDGGQGYVMRKYLKSSSTSTMYVKKDDTPLRGGPSEAFDQTATLYAGNKVRVLSSGSTWSYISATAGTGYVKKSQLSSSVVKSTGVAGSPYEAYISNPNGNTVNLRRGPGKDYEVVEELNPGTKVTVESIVGDWAGLYGGGYVMKRYISKTEPDPTPTLEPGTTPTPKPVSRKIRYLTSKNGKNINVRRGPSEKGYAVAISLPVGTEVTLISSEKGWAKISSDAMVGTGYVKTQYLSKSRPGVTATPAPGETPKPTKEPYPARSATVVNPAGNKVNVRQGAGKGYATMTQLEPGTAITVIGESGSWYKIEFPGGTGYMMKEYVD